MKIEFTLNVPPFSINSAFYKRTHTRTKACRDWFDKVYQELAQENIVKLLKAFKKEWDPIAHGIAITLEYNIPSKKFWTHTREVSLFSQDLSNVEKLLIDAIFDEKYDGRQVTLQDGRVHTITNLAINDKAIVDLHSSKIATAKSAPFVVVSIQILDFRSSSK